MSQFPVAGYVSNNARTEGEMKTALEEWLATTKQLPGGAAVSTLTIASGSVTPTGSRHAIDTEAAAATDDLTNIVQTNMPDGSVVVLSNVASGRALVFKHGAGGTGQLAIQGGTDFTLSDPEDRVAFQREGTTWVESMRNRKADRLAAPLGHLGGYGLSNNFSDAVNDIDIAAGEAASEDAASASRVLLAGTAMTKRLDAVWAAGTNAGGRLSTDTYSTGTFHCYAFRRAGGAIDYVFSKLLNPTLPDGGTNKRRIGSIMVVGTTIFPFVQEGDYFGLSSPFLSVNTTNVGTAALLATLQVPSGMSVIAILNVIATDTTANRILWIADPTQADDAPSVTAAPLGNAGNPSGGNAWYHYGQLMVRTNPTAQIRYRWSATGAATILRIATVGWFDRRGRG